jgi:Calx-beta domain
MRRLLVVVALCFLATAPAPAAAQDIPLTLSIADVRVNEAAGSAVFTVTVSFPTRTLDVDYTTADDTATNLFDFRPTSGTVTIPAESLSARIVVPILDDPVDEPDETFTVRLSNPTGGALTRSVAVGTILDDDGRPSLPTIAPRPEPVAPTTAPIVLPTVPPTLRPGETTLPQPGTTVPVPTSVAGATTTSAPPPTATGPDGGPRVGERQRSEFVRSVMAPGDVSFDIALVARSVLLAALLVLLVAFPAELFNATLLANYEEISGWFGGAGLTRAREALQRLPGGLTLAGFASAGAILYSQLSPDFGLNRASLSLLLGMFVTLVLVSLVYDQARAWYLGRRFGVGSRLRAQLTGLVVGMVLVLFSRLAGFLPGYVYGVFTALVFTRGAPDERQDGEGLTVASWVLLALGVVAWFVWSPVRDAAGEDGAAFGLLVLDAALASLWVAAVAAIVFGLAPIRFFYGEQVKAWNRPAWWALYGLGMLVFVHAVMDPDRGFYGKADEASLTSILALFVAFGAFSTLFWAYFRYRHMWRRP